MVLENVRRFEEARGGKAMEDVDPDAAGKNMTTIIKEVLYTTNEQVDIDDNVYSLTIAANMTKNCSPTHFLYCLRMCIFVYVIQILIAVFFGWETLDFTGFNLKNFTPMHTIMRIVCSIFLQLSLNKDLKPTAKMLTFLKRQRGSSKNLRGRYVNLMLCFMQITAPLMTQIFFSI